MTSPCPQELANYSQDIIRITSMDDMIMDNNLNMNPAPKRLANMDGGSAKNRSLTLVKKNSQAYCKQLGLPAHCATFYIYT